MQKLKDIIDQRIAAKGYTKDLIINAIGMSRAGWYSALEKESFSLKNFKKLSDLLDIEPNKYFEYGSEIDIYQLKEPEIPYRKVKNYTNEVLKSEGSESETVKELLKQNAELIAIIKNLTK
ncbi:hypothetical protein [Lacihabitans soyangensis]|uniref:Uncharacterized protein n=1 Tax=Lacihabitans soyangensis TaxID=869394 RepID=A0AAE3KWC6_9BACT|nr:hypothetical protein [Lacihabitans soyangensis]MCP9762655.1 hypothetical protein [Lacihabitans soyangensis]MCP9764188.1 hypothetical protein [Lacihabitans soyangensis]